MTLRILIPDVLSAPSAIATAETVASASLTDDNLLTPEPWQKWRSVGTNPRDTLFFAQVNGDPLFPVDGIALAGLNLTPGNGEVMAILVGGGLGYPIYEALQPSSIIASNAITGVVGDVDEGINAATDSAYIKPTTDAASYVTLAMANPLVSPRTGSRRQAVVLRVRASADTTGAAAYMRPTVTVKLYENVAGVSTFRATLGTKAVHGTAQHLLFFSFDASLLTNANGSDAQFRVEFTAGPASCYAWLDALEWQCESDQITSQTIVAETGWSTILAEPSSRTGYDFSTQVAENYSRWSVKFGQVYQAARVYVFIREDHVPSETSVYLNRFLLPTPPGYVECGKMAAGLWWSPAVNRSQGQFVTVDDPSEKFDDEGGGEWGSREEPRDSFRITLDSLTETEAAWLNWRLLHEVGILSPFYLELEPDATFELRFGGWVTLLSVSNPISRRTTDVYKYSMEFTVRIKR